MSESRKKLLKEHPEMNPMTRVESRMKISETKRKNRLYKLCIEDATIIPEKTLLY